jgi:hypothetical protein
MDNPETLANLGTQDTGRQQIKQKNIYIKKYATQQIKKMSNTNPTTNLG